MSSHDPDIQNVERVIHSSEAESVLECLEHKYTALKIQRLSPVLAMVYEPGSSPEGP
jgi:hypothetical protein